MLRTFATAGKTAMTFLSYASVALSLLLISAHFLRYGGWMPAAAVLALGLLLLIRQPWAARTIQLALVLASLEWIRTLYELAIQRQHAGLPWLRMAVILGAVAALTAFSAWLFQTARLGRRYGLGGR